MPAPPDIPDYTFGIELEVLMPRRSCGPAGRSELARVLTAAGIPAAAENWNHETRDHWKLTTDGTIGYDNTEIVSPILSGADGLEKVRQLCRAINEFGCGVNRACGFHVHIGVRDRFSQRVGMFKELQRTYHRFERVIDQLIAPSRRGNVNQWCQQPVWNEQVERARNLEDLRRLLGGKYRKIGIDSYWRHGTLEFRHHQGTINGEKVTNWVMFCLRMIAHAAKNTEVSRESEARPAYRPPAAPQQRDLNTGTPLRSDQIPRFTNEHAYELRDMVITRVTPIGATSRRNQNSAGYANYSRFNLVGTDLWSYRRNGGRRTHLAWDVEHGYVRVVRRSDCRLIVEVPVTPAPAAPAAPTPAPISRPATDTTPVTLEGLFTLLEMSEHERSFFTERQMELNA